MITKTGPEGTTTYEYYYDPVTGCQNNNLKRVVGFNGIIKENTYDALARLIMEKETVDGADYFTSFEYNNYSQVISESFPSGFLVNTEYDENSYVKRLYFKTNIFFSESVLMAREGTPPINSLMG